MLIVSAGSKFDPSRYEIGYWDTYAAPNYAVSCYGSLIFALFSDSLTEWLTSAVLFLGFITGAFLS